MQQTQEEIFRELQRYANLTVVPGVTVGRLSYVANTDLYSKGVTPALSSGVVPDDTEIKLFHKAIGETGQGWSAGLTEAQTNIKFDNGTMDANECYLATHAGFKISLVDAVDPSATLTEALVPTPSALFGIGAHFSWELQEGRGNKRIIGSLLDWPAGSGVWASHGQNLGGINTGSHDFTASHVSQNGAPDCLMRRLPDPIVFRPLVNTSISVKCGAGFTVVLPSSPVALDAYAIQITMILKGYQFTMGVG